MDRARSEDAWLHTANVMALIHNRTLGPKEQGKTATDFDPFKRQPDRKVVKFTKESIGDLKLFFTGSRD